MSKLYLIRHGETCANEEHRYCGSTDLPLSDRGKEKLKRLSYAIQDARFVTSGMKRTEETLHCLFGDVPFKVMPEFREVNFGIFEMHSYEEIKNTKEYQEWISGDNENNVPPSGESGTQMMQRVLGALPYLLEEDTVLVTHGGVIACIMQHLYPELNRNRYEWQPSPGHGYEINGNSYRSIP